MKTQQVHIRLDSDDLSFLDELADGIVSRQLAATILLKKAIRRLRESEDRPQLFASFRIDPGSRADLSLNEEPVTYKVKGKK